MSKNINLKKTCKACYNNSNNNLLIIVMKIYFFSRYSQ